MGKADRCGPYTRGVGRRVVVAQSNGRVWLRQVPMQRGLEGALMSLFCETLIRLNQPTACIDVRPKGSCSSSRQFPVTGVKDFEVVPSAGIYSAQMLSLQRAAASLVWCSAAHTSLPSCTCGLMLTDRSRTSPQRASAFSCVRIARLHLLIL